MAEKKAAKTMPSKTEDRQKALEIALQQIEKSYGKGAVMRLGQNANLNVESIPTGSLALDAALGIGGLPRGRRSTVPNRRVRRHWRCMPWRKPKSAAAKRRLSTWNTRSIPSMRRHSV